MKSKTNAKWWVFSAFLLIFSFELNLSHADTTQLFTFGPSPVEIHHDRSDIYAGTLMMQIYCLKSADNTWYSHDCAEVTVDGKPVDGFWQFESTQKNEFTVPPISILYHKEAADALCVGMKVLFKGCAPEQGCSNTYDYQLYRDQEDRYTFLSYCTVDTLPAQFSDVAFFAHRRVKTFDEFKAGMRSVRLELNEPKK